MSRLVLRRSTTHGLGVFAAAPLCALRVLGEYDGPRYAPGAELPANPYLWELADGTVIDGSVTTWRYLNHSCDANAEIREERGRALIITLRPIARGEEVTIYYRIAGADGKIRRCRCGAKHCRRRFT